MYILGSEVFQLSATDRENDPLSYGIRSNVFRVSNPSDGRVYLNQQLDREVRLQS